MKVKLKIIITGVLMTLLTACASTPHYNIRGTIATLYGERSDVSQVIEIPSSNNSLSNAIMIASIESGSDSNGINDLVRILQSNIESIAVIGQSDAVVVATIKASVGRLTSDTATKIYFIGEQKYVDELTAFSQESGVTIDALTYPNKI